MRPFFQKPFRGNTPFFVVYGDHYPFPTHWHGEIEILYVTEGRLTVTVEGQKYELPANTLMIVGCAEIHSVDTVAEGSSVLLIEMGYELLGDGFSAFSERYFPKRLYRLSPAGEYASVRNCLYSIISLFQEPKKENGDSCDSAARSFRMQSYLFQCAAEILSSFPTQPLPKQRRSLMENMLSMQHICDYVNHHFQEQITLETAAELSGYEKTRFCQLFRHAMGVSFHKYLNDCRIEAAKRLLVNSEASIQEIAEQTGFSQDKTFSRVFREVTSETPSGYRTRMRDNN